MVQTGQHGSIVDLMWAAGADGLRRYWSFESFPKAGDQEALRSVMEWYYNRHTPGLLLYGKAGTGKTGLALSVLRQAIVKQWKEGDEDTRYMWMVKSNSLLQHQVTAGQHRRVPAQVWFESWMHMQTRLRSLLRRDGDDEANDSYEEALEALHQMAVLAVDDIDVGSITPWKEEVLLHVLCRVEQGRVLVMTTNKHPLEIRENLGERVADRLADASLFTNVSVQGHSLRRR